MNTREVVRPTGISAATGDDQSASWFDIAIDLGQGIIGATRVVGGVVSMGASSLAAPIPPAAAAAFAAGALEVNAGLEIAFQNIEAAAMGITGASR